MASKTSISRERSISFPPKLVMIAAGRVILRVIRDRIVKSDSLKKPIFFRKYPSMMMATKHPARVKISNIRYSPYLRNFFKISFFSWSIR